MIPDTCPLFKPGQLAISYSENRLNSLNGSNYIEVSDNTFLQKKINNFLAENKIFINKQAVVSSPEMAIQLAVQQKATTITTASLAQKVLGNRSDYNLMIFPKEKFNLEIAITRLNDANEIIKLVYRKLLKILPVIM